jgi:RNA polymerase sigma-70 factor (ECF subfamily)
VDERFPSHSQQQTLRLLGDNEFSRLVERFVAAWEQNDVDAIVSMLADDARMTMPPLPSWYSGRPQVAPFLRGFTLASYQALAADSTLATDNPPWRATSGSSNRGVHAVLPLRPHHGRTPDRRDHGLLVTPDTFQRFGLPESFAG